MPARALQPGGPHPAEVLQHMENEARAWAVRFELPNLATRITLRWHARLRTTAGLVVETGTAREVRNELWSIYGLRVCRIPLRRPSQRRHLPPQVYARAEEKWAALLAEVQQRRAQEQPVLIGTGSVAESEQLSARLAAAAVPHWVSALNHKTINNTMKY